MAYCDQADMLKLLPERTLITLTADEGLGEVDASRLAEAIAQADAEIDGYVGRRYAVPLATVPALVRKFSVDMAVYNLYSRRATGAVPEVRRERYTDAIKRLEAIAKGTATLGTDAEPAASSAVAPGFTTQDEDSQIFTRESMGGF